MGQLAKAGAFTLHNQLLSLGLVWLLTRMVPEVDCDLLGSVKYGLVDLDQICVCVYSFHVCVLESLLYCQSL